MSHHHPCHRLPFEILAIAAEGGPIRPDDARHLHLCASCRRAAGALRDQARALRALARPRQAPSLRERILARARAEARARIVEAVQALVAREARRGGDDTTELLFEVAVLGRRLELLDELLGEPVERIDLQRWGSDAPGVVPWAERLLARVGHRTVPSGAGRDASLRPGRTGRHTPRSAAHQPRARPSFRDSLAPR